MIQDNLSIQDVRAGVKILQKAEEEFKKKLYSHLDHGVEPGYWALQGCDDCCYQLIKNSQN